MNVDQGGTSPPDRDYYLKDDPKNKEVREQYVAHMTKMFELAGDAHDAAATEAQAVLTLETKLASAQLDRVARRDPKNRDNRGTLATLQDMAHAFDFVTYFAAAHAPAFTERNNGWPKFCQALNGTWDTSLADPRCMCAGPPQSAPMLASNFEKEDFAFFSTSCAIKEQPARWKTCVANVDGNLGEALASCMSPGIRRRQQGAHEGMVDALTVAPARTSAASSG